MRPLEVTMNKADPNPGSAEVIVLRAPRHPRSLQEALQDALNEGTARDRKRHAFDACQSPLHDWIERQLEQNPDIHPDDLAARLEAILNPTPSRP